MASLFEIGLINAALATVLAVVVWLVTRVWRQPVLVHALWVVVLVKLITPPMLTLPWQLPNTSNVSPIHVEPTPAVASSAFDVASPPLRSIEYAPLFPQPETAADAMDAALAPPSPPSTQVQAERLPQTTPPLSLPWLAIVATLWLAGSAIFLIVTIVRLARFHRALARTSPASEDLHELAEKVAARLGVSGRYRLRVTEGRLSPLVWPIGRPTILLSRTLLEELSPDQTQTLLAHELAHLRRRDHWVRWLELAAVTIYWWLPVVWWARGVIRKTEEQACDAWVVWALPDAAKRYAAALFTVTELISEPRPAAPLVASRLDAGTNLKERIEAVMNGNCECRLSMPVRMSILLLALLILPLSLRAVHAADDEPSNETAQNDAATDSAPAAALAPETSPTTANPTPPTKANLGIARSLEIPVKLQFHDTPLTEVVAGLSDAVGVDIHLDPRALNQEGVASDTPVSINLRSEVSLESALNLILEPLHLTYVIEDEVLKVTSAASRDAISPDDRLRVEVIGVDPAHPIQDVFRVESGGTLPLGPKYDRVQVAGRTLSEAEDIVRAHLRKDFKDPLVQITEAVSPGDTSHSGAPDQRTANYSATSGADAEELAVLREHIDFLKARFAAGEMTGYELETAQADLAEAEGRFDAAEAHLKEAKAFAEQALKLVTARFESGRATNNDVLRAANNLMESKRRVLRISDMAAAPSNPRATAAASRREDPLVPAGPTFESSQSLRVWEKIVEGKKQDYDRLQALADRSLISDAELSKAKNDYAISIAKLDQAKRALKYNQLLVELAETELQEALEKNNRAPNSVSEFELRKLRIKVELAKVKMSAAE